MNRILVVDDIRTFPIYERENRVTYARTSGEALTLLRMEEFEEVWLDHDLGGSDTSRPVVQWLEERRPGSIEIIRILTDNPPGRDWIVLALRRFDWALLVRTGTDAWRRIA